MKTTNAENDHNSHQNNWSFHKHCQRVFSAVDQSFVDHFM